MSKETLPKPCKHGRFKNICNECHLEQEVLELKNKVTILGSFASKVRMECGKRKDLEVYKDISFFQLMYDSSVRILDQSNGGQQLAELKAESVLEFLSSNSMLGFQTMHFMTICDQANEWISELKIDAKNLKGDKS